ncbi:retrovirus-related pol polyprotein from transposon TNT 1-94 [Tanacetum coccineum]
MALFNPKPFQPVKIGDRGLAAAVGKSHVAHSLVVTFELLSFTSLCKNSFKEYEKRHKNARMSSSSDDKIKEVPLKLPTLPSGCSPGMDNIHLSYIKNLRDAWNRGQISIVFDDQERTMRIALFIHSLKDVTLPFLLITTADSLSQWEAMFLKVASCNAFKIYTEGTEGKRSFKLVEVKKEGGQLAFQLVLYLVDAFAKGNLVMFLTLSLHDLNILKAIQWQAVIVDESQSSEISSHFSRIKSLSTVKWLLVFCVPLGVNMTSYLDVLSKLDLDVISKTELDDMSKLKETLSNLIAYECNSNSSKFVEFRVPVQISNVQLEQYCSMLLSNAMALSSCSKTDTVGAVHDILVSNRKCCDHPYIAYQSLRFILTKGLDLAKYLDVGIKASGKLQFLDLILPELRKRKLRVLILYQPLSGYGKDSTSIGDILDDFLRQRFGEDSYERINRVGIDSVSPVEPPEFTSADDHPAFNKHDLSELADILELAEIQYTIINEPICEPMAGITTRSKVKDSKAASAHECMYVNFLSKMEPKKLIEALKEKGWIIAMQEELESIKIFLAYAAYMGFMVYQMDVKSAFVNGKILEEVYVQQPHGFKSSDVLNHVCKLDKALYALKQAPRAWYETLSKFLIQHKFVREKYVKDLLKKYNLAESASVKCSMLPPNNLGPDESGVSVNEMLFSGMIGSLMYLTASRPDIQFSACLCDRYQANPKESHLVVVKRIFRYLKGTPNPGFWIPKGSGFILKAYSDSYYAGCNLDRKSTSGGCQILGGKLVCWSAKKQSSVAISSAEAEYVATARCCAQVLWIKSQLADYDVIYDKVPIFCNNTSVIAISNNPVLHSRTKCIDIMYHFIRDHILKGDIELHLVPTDLQLADIFTKSLAEPSFTRLVAELGMCCDLDATLQHVVALSTTEAEYMALTEAVKEAIWLRGLLEELGVKLNSVAVNCGNQGAIHLSQNHVFHERTKHINVLYHFIKEVLEAKTVEVLKVGAEHNFADALTKPAQRLSLSVFYFIGEALSWYKHFANNQMLVTDQIGNNLSFVHSASVLWNELQEHYSQLDVHRIYQLTNEITQLIQTNCLVEMYYQKLKGLWDEIDALEAPYMCTCNCVYANRRLNGAREGRKRLLQFLMGLDEYFSNVRGQILLMQPLPNTTKAYAMPWQEEKQEKQPLLNILLPQSCQPSQTQGSLKTTILQQTLGQTDPSQLQTPGKITSKQESFICGNYQKEGHYQNECYEIVGYPVGHPLHGKFMPGSSGNVNWSNRTNFRPRTVNMATIQTNGQEGTSSEATTSNGTQNDVVVFAKMDSLQNQLNQVMLMLQNSQGQCDSKLLAVGRYFFIASCVSFFKDAWGSR